MSDPSSPPTAARFLPWRSARVGWLLTALLLLAGIPLFLRMPPWCDITLYDMAARAVMSGGVHYRDIFDTNLPGYVWLLVGVRRAFGPSIEAVRAVDLLIVGVSVWLLLGLTRKCGATQAGVAWMAAGVALLYPFSSEFNHCQRDVWMLLPALAAVRLRLARPVGDRPFRRGLLEGVLWGCAVWIKPHVVIPAAAVWLCSADRVGGSRRGTRADFFGNIVGGLLVGTAGVGWLVGTGTWPHFWDVFTHWNGQYMQLVWLEFGLRAQDHLYYFVPWSFLHPFALYLAVRFVWPPRRPRWFVPAEDDEQQRARVLLAALFIAWSAQAFLLQRRFHYAHVPETFLLMAVLTVQRWAVTPFVMGYLGLVAGMHAWADILPPVRERMNAISAAWEGFHSYTPRHPVTDPERWKWWAECWRADLKPREYAVLQDEVSLHYGFFASISMSEIQQLDEELKRLGAKDGEVLCWHDSPHAVYLPLGHRPRFRFMHVSTVLMGDPNDSRTPYYRMRTELRSALPGTRFVVTDLKRHFLAAPPSTSGRTGELGPDLLPPAMTAWARQTFPFDQPAVFRTSTPSGRPGRYLIHELKHPVGLIEYDVDPWAGVE